LLAVFANFIEKIDIKSYAHNLDVLGRRTANLLGAGLHSYFLMVCHPKNIFNMLFFKLTRSSRLLRDRPLSALAWLGLLMIPLNNTVDDGKLVCSLKL